jgi:nickel-dependent lactate racemase
MRRPENGPANTGTATVQVSLKYGKGSVRLEIPKDRLLEVVKPRSSVRRGQSIPEALAAPVGAEPLRRLVDRNDKVAVVVSDITRPCPTRAILPFVMRSLKASGVPRENVRILIGTGTHRGHTPAEKRTLLGSYASSIPQIVDHNMDSVQYVGTTRRGTKVSVNPFLLDADFALAIGNVDVHYFAGYTGGYKAVVPGLAGKETIERNHSLMTLPNAEPAVVESNPVREDLEEAGRMTGLRYVVNVVQDERKRIVSSFAGDPIAAQRAAIKTVDDLVKVPVRESADIVVASAGGYPRDINLYQAHKAIENASHAVKAGGTIILVAECREGFGNSTFETWMTSASSLDEVGEKLSKHFILGAHKVFALSKIAKRAEIIVASNKFQTSSLILRTCKKPQDALDGAWRSHGKDASILLMPYAMNTLPETPSDL